MDGFLKILDNSADFEEISGGLAKGQSPLSVMGVCDSVRAHLSFALCKKRGKAPFFITSTDAQARILWEDLRFFYGDKVLLFPTRDLLFYDIEASATDIKKKRLEVLEKLVTKPSEYAVVTTASALVSPTVEKTEYNSRAITLNVDDEIEMDALADIMCDLGYKREDLVEGRGQFSVRGGIFDFFPYWSEAPFRIEFFDTLVDSVRLFDPETQRTLGAEVEIPEARITPADEIVISGEIREKVVKTLSKRITALEKKDTLDETQQRLLETLKADREKFEQGVVFPSRDKYIPDIYPAEIPTLIDYITDDYIIFLDDYSRIQESLKSEADRMQETVKDLIERGILYGGKWKFGGDFADVIKNRSESMVSLCPLSHAGGELKPKKLVSFTAKSLNSFGGKMEFFYDSLQFYKKNKYRIIILAGSEHRCDNLALQLEDEGFPCTKHQSLDDIPNEGSILVVPGSISRGFEYPLIRTVVMCDKEIFGEKRKKRHRYKMDKKNKIDNFTDLSVGDFVVHQNHGVGQYMGLERLTVEGAQRDYLKIVYKGGDNLYVPTDQLGYIYKHTSSDTGKVKLNRLGGQDWIKAKQKVRNSCQDMAKEHISL